MKILRLKANLVEFEPLFSSGLGQELFREYKAAFDGILAGAEEKGNIKERVLPIQEKYTQSD